MAYTGTPLVQTYATETISAAYDIDLRPDSNLVQGIALNQDSGMVNLIPIKHASTSVTSSSTSKTDDIEAITRQPIHGYAVVAGQINRGCYTWEKTIGTVYYFTVCGTGVYTSTDGVTWALVNTLLTSATTPVRFTEFIDGTNTKTLVMVDGIEGYVFSSNAAGTKITDVDFPSPHVPFPVYLDGYLFLAKAGTGDVYNSDLLDPTAWTPGSFLSSELYPDDVQALVKVNNYLLVVGTEGCEFFYDAQGAPGTPLARSDSLSLPFGTQFPNSIASNKDTVIMIANNNDGENSVRIIQDFKAENVNPSFLINALNARLETATNPATSTGVRGFFFRQGGLLHYGLAFQGDVASPSLLNSTFVYCFDTQFWTEFRAGATGSAPFPVYFTASSTSSAIVTFVSGHIDGYSFFGKMEDGAKSPFTIAATDVIQNGATNAAIYTEIRTPSLDFGTMNLKTMSRLGIVVTENTSSSSTSGTPLQVNVEWSDDDYATWQGPQTLVFAAANNYPFLRQLGMFRKRAFRITYASTSFLRYMGITLDINRGNQ